MGTILSGLSPNHRCMAIGAEQWGYIANGYDVMKCWDGLLAAAVDAGKTSPLSAPLAADVLSGVVAAGIHFIRYRYLSSRTGWPSDPGPQVSHDAAGSKQIALSNIPDPTDLRVDKVVIEMTLAGGTDYFEAVQVDSGVTSQNVNVSDTTLSEQPYDYADSGHEVPPRGRLMAYVKGRMFVAAPEEHAIGHATCAGSTTRVTFASADIRSAVTGLYFVPDGTTAAYQIATTPTIGDSGAVDLAANYPAALTGVTYRITPSAEQRNRVYVSDALYPESFLTSQRYFRALQGTGDVLRALKGYRGSLLIFGLHTMEVCEWEVDPTSGDDGRLYQSPGNRGAINQECVVEHEGVVYALDRQGVYSWSGEAPRRLSDAISDIIDAINWQYHDRFHAIWNPVLDQLEVYVCYGTETYPQTCLVWDKATEDWSTRHYDVPITASGQGDDGDENQRVMLLTLYGRTFFSDIGYSDGVYPDTSMSPTVASASLLVVTFASGTSLYTTGEGLDGLGAYWVEGDELRIVDSNTETAITVKTAFSAPPDAGDTIRIGRIVAKRRTKRFKIGSPVEDQKEVYLAVEFTPLTSGTMIFRVYENGSGVAKQDWKADTQTPGVTFQEGSADVLIDLSKSDGYVKIPLGEVWHHTVEFEFEINAPDTPAELIDFYLLSESAEDVIP